MNPICPEPNDYRQLLNGEADADQVLDLSVHLGDCPKCSDTVQMLLEQDTLASRLIAGSQVIPAKPLPAGLLDRLIALSAVRSSAGGETMGFVSESEESNNPTDMLSPPLAAGEMGRLGTFIVRKILGHGGMGVVFLAEDPRLEREVALKVIRTTVAKNPTARKRFLSEARSAAKVKSDHIVTIYDIGESEGTAYVAMEVLKGTSLGASMNAGKSFTLSQILRMARETALGLAAAHEKGLIHRDIKPDNIWLEAPNNRVKLLDFGLARPVEQEIHLTNEGMIVGTPAFMAPEQANGHRLDARSDLFSFGCVLYRLLTGRLPFPGASVLETLNALATIDPPRVRSINPGLPPELDDLVARLLAKNPDRRPASARDVVDELSAIEARMSNGKSPAIAVTPTAKTQDDRTELDFSAQIAEQGQPAKAEVRTAHRRKFPIVAVVALAFALLGGGALAVYYQFTVANKDGALIVEVADDADVRFKNGKLEIYDESGKKLYTLEPGERNKTLPAGKYLVKVLGADGVKLDTPKFEMERKGKVLVKVTADEPQVAANIPPPSDPKISKQPKSIPIPPAIPLTLPKGAWPLGPKENALPGLIPQPAILDGIGRWQIFPTVVIPTVQNGAFGFNEWSPDGKWIAMADAWYVYIYESQFGELKAIVRRSVTHPGEWPSVSWSPDSRWIRCGDKSRGLQDISLVGPDGTASVASALPNAEVDYGWNPKRPVFACMFAGIRDRIQIIDPTQPKPIEALANPGLGGKAAWSPDGEWLLVVREDKTAQLFSRDGKPGAKLAGVVDPSLAPAWSEDSNTIAALVSPTEIGFWKKDGTAGAKTAAQEKPVVALVWKPDGKIIAAAEAGGKQRFWKIDGSAEGVVDTQTDNIGLTWAKDGKGFFTHGRFWPAIQPSFVELAHYKDGFLVSPDRSTIVKWSGREVVVNGVDGGMAKDMGWTIPSQGFPSWSPDGKKLAVMDRTGLTVYDARDSRKFVQFGGGVAAHGLRVPAFSPKGDRSAMGSQTGHVYLCEATGKLLRVIPPPAKVNTPPWAAPHTIHDVQWSPDGKYVAITIGIVEVRIVDTETGEVVAETALQGNRPGGSAIFSPANPDHLFITHPDAAALWRWKVEKDPLQKVDGLGKLVPSPDGKQILSMQCGGGIHGNDFRYEALVSLDLKSRDATGTKDYVPETFYAGPSLAWHPDSSKLVLARNKNNAIRFRSLDGKVIEQIKLEGIDATQLEWISPIARRNILIGRIGPEVHLFDLSTKKLTPFGKVNGELTASPDGKYLIALEDSRMTYWNLETKAIDQIVQLLPDVQCAIFSAAGELLFKSAGAAKYLRCAVEDRNGRLSMQEGSAFWDGRK